MRAIHVPIVRLMSSDGIGGGTTDWIGDYSAGTGTPTAAKYIADSVAPHTLIRRLIFEVQDTGNFDTDKWGNGIVLTEGFDVVWHDADDSVIATLTHEPIKTSGFLAANMFDVTLHNFGTGDNTLVGRYAFDDFCGDGITMTPGQFLEIHLDDDMSALVHQHFIVQGSQVFQEGDVLTTPHP